MILQSYLDEWKPIKDTSRIRRERGGEAARNGLDDARFASTGVSCPRRAIPARPLSRGLLAQQRGLSAGLHHGFAEPQLWRGITVSRGCGDSAMAV